MGYYAIVVIGVGAHGNPPSMPESDADDLAAELVAVLKERGHRIFEASFISLASEGVRESLEGREGT